MNRWQFQRKRSIAGRERLNNNSNSLMMVEEEEDKMHTQMTFKNGRIMLRTFSNEGIVK